MAVEQDLGACLTADSIGRRVEPEPLLDRGAGVGQRVQIAGARRAPAQDPAGLSSERAGCAGGSARAGTTSTRARGLWSRERPRAW